MLRRLMIVTTLTSLLYFGVVMVVCAQTPSPDQVSRLQDQNREIENHTTTNAVKIAELERQIKELQDQKIGERLAVMEATAAMNYRFLIGICISMIPLVIDVFRRWSPSHPREPEVDVDFDG